MSKLHVLTLISVLLLAVVVGCSSSDQGAIDKTVSPTLTAAQPATAAPTATSTPEPTAEPTPLTISTELSNCVTTIAYLASNHWHNPPGQSGRGPQLNPSYIHPQPFDMLNHYCGSYIDSQLLEKFNARDWDVPALLPLERLK